MSYNTKFTLTTDRNEAETHEIITELRSENEEAEYALDENGFTEEPSAWYDASDDLCNFSLKYPGILFTLQGEGEDSVDIWRMYVKNGQKQLVKAVITFDEFDEGKLVKTEVEK